jgi:exodeoxyribonuclease V gamma subunit
VRFLALTAAQPDRRVEAATVGRFRFTGRRKGAVSIARLAPLAGDPADRRATALAHLGSLVELYERGLCEPLPLYCKTSAAWAETPRDKREKTCTGLWEPQNDLGLGENQEPEHQLVLGGAAAFGDLLTTAPGADESGAGWVAGEATRFGRYALRLWHPILAVEEVWDR